MLPRGWRRHLRHRPSAPRTRAECFHGPAPVTMSCAASAPRTRAECFRASGIIQSGPGLLLHALVRNASGTGVSIFARVQLLLHALVRNASSYRLLRMPPACGFCSTHSCGMLRLVTLNERPPYSFCSTHSCGMLRISSVIDAYTRIFCSTHSCGMLRRKMDADRNNALSSAPRTRAECFARAVRADTRKTPFCSTHSCGMLRQDPTISWLREDDAEAVCTNAWSHIIPARGSPTRNGAQDSDDMSVRRCEHPRRPAGDQGSHSSVGTDLPPMFSFPCFVLFVSFDVYGVSCRFFVQAALAL